MEQATVYMLDTNMVSFAIKGMKSVQRNLSQVPMASVCISTITEAELLHGLAKKRGATQLHKLVHEFLLRVEVFPWDSKAAQAYADFRILCESKGKSLGNMDMLIAAHCKAIDATLVTNDKAFYQLDKFLDIADWSQ